RYQFGAVLSENDFLDQRINGWILDADKVTRAGPVCRLRTPEVALFVARRKRLWPARNDDVVVPLAKAIFVLRRVHHAHIHVHAETFKRRFGEQDEPLGGRIIHEKFESKRLAALGIDKLGVANLVSGLTKQSERLAQVVTH